MAPRLEALHRELRLRSLLASTALLAIALVALDAQAQGLEAASQLTDSLNEKALATVAALLLLAVIFLFRELQKSQAARLEDLTKAHESAMAVQETSIKLSIQSLEAIEVVEKLVERSATKEG